jgi:glycosyltransferase involved in cell wall biosynthesis
MTTFNKICSVLMPAYNAEKYISKAIESILAQTYRNFELIILDDGSHDSTNNIAQSYARQDPRVKVHRQENSGVIVSLNQLVELSTGEILFRMDADDVSLDTRFERQLAYLEQHPEVIALGSRVQLMDPDGDPINDDFFNAVTHEQIDGLNLSVRAALCHPAVAMRKSAVVKLGGYRSEYAHAEDLDLFLRMAELGRLANLEETLLRYRLHPDSIGHTKTQHQFRSASAAVNEARRRRGISATQHDEALPLPSAEHRLQDHHEKWAWWALKGGHLITAKKHAKHVFLSRPFSLASVKLLFCALRGY